MNSSADPTQHITVVPRSLSTSVPRDTTVMPIDTPAGSAIPTMGWPKFWYWVKLLFNKDATTPKISKKQAEAERQALAVAERIANEAAVEAQRVSTREQSIARLRELSDEKPRLTVAFIGVKGAAGTTTTMVNSTSTVADITRTLVYACDFNPASGSAGMRLGKNFNETMSLREFRKIVDEIDAKFNMVALGIAASTADNMDSIDFREAVEDIDNRSIINARLRPTKYGPRVLSADDYVLETTEQFGTSTVKMLDILSKNCDYLFIDTANDITTTASRAVLDKADVLVFTANVGIKDSLFMLYTSMEKVRQLRLREKVANSVVVISNLPEGAELNDYRKYLNRVNISDQVIQPITAEDFHGPFMGVPHDPVIARDGQVELEKYADATYQAYVDIDIAIFEQALNIEAPGKTLTRRVAPQFGTPMIQPAG